MAWTRQKPEQNPPQPTARTKAEPARAPSPNPPSFRESAPNRAVNIGKSVHIKGDVTAKEDLTIDGTVDGRIVVKDNAVTIGPNGRITNRIQAKSVIVAGEVHGNITSADKVEIAATGSMLGDISAPRVVLADGARFKGSIDMEPKGDATRSAGAVTSPADSKTAANQSQPDAATDRLQRSA